MASILQISTTRLRDGDSFTFSINPSSTANVETYTIAIVDVDDPLLLQAKDTSDVIPKAEEWKTAVQRLTDAIADIPKVTNVTNNLDEGGTLISIEVNTEIVDPNNPTSGVKIQDKNGDPIGPDGSRIVWCKYINDGEPPQTNDPALIPSIRILGVNHRVLLPNATSRQNFPHGNAFTRVKTEIDFATDSSTANSLNYRFGYVGNNVELTPNGGTTGDYAIDPTYFTDNITGTAQGFNFKGLNNVTGTPVEPDYWNNGTAQVLPFAGAYRIDHVHNLPVKFFEETFPDDVQQAQPEKPDILNNESLKFCCQLDILENDIDLSPTESTATQDTKNFFPKGNIGWFGSTYANGPRFATLESVNWLFGDVLDSGRRSSCVVQIDTGNVSASGLDYVLRIQELNDPKEGLSYQENTKLSEVKGVVNGQGGNTDTLLNVSASSNTSGLELIFTVEAAKISDRYIVWLELSNGTTSQNISIDVNTAESGTDDSVIDFEVYPSGSISQYSFLPHYQTVTNLGFPNCRGAAEDIFLARFRFANDDTENTTITGVKFKVASIEGGNDQRGESFGFSKSDIDNGVLIDRGFPIPEDSERRKIKIEADGNGYNVDFPFQLRSEWSQIDDLALITTVEFTQVLANGAVLSGSRSFYSPPFEVAPYNVTLADDVSEPILSGVGVGFNGVVITDNSTGNAVLSIPKKKGAEFTIDASFENVNNVFPDFNQEPSAPFTYQNNVFIDQYLCGYIGLTDGEKVYQFSNLRNNLDQEFITAPAGGDKFAELETTAINAIISAKVKTDDLLDFFGDFECLTITARLDKIQFPDPAYGEYSTTAFSNAFNNRG